MSILPFSSADAEVALPAAGPCRSSGWRSVRMMPTPPESGTAETRREDEDAELIRRVARGDREAFASVYDRYSRPLFAIALRVLNDAREAEDIVHDVFIALWNKAGDFESDRGTAFGWCVTLTRNRAIDRVRARKRRGELLAESAPADLGYDENQAENADSGDMLWQKEKAAVVRQALESLPVEQRAALQLAYFGGLTQQEIAAKLSEPLGTVKARIRRGLLKLRELLPQGL
jgi:RNA polymerase sigma-70 factor (ECF subfamily)